MRMVYKVDQRVTVLDVIPGKVTWSSDLMVEVEFTVSLPGRGIWRGEKGLYPSNLVKDDS